MESSEENIETEAADTENYHTRADNVHISVQSITENSESE